MDSKESMVKIISKSSSLCNKWAAGRCYHPSGWRDAKLTDEQVSKLPDCICKPGNTETICENCEPDTVLFECRPSLFKEDS